MDIIVNNLLISILVYFCYFCYLNRMFENDRNYQYLSEVEREMSLTSEQALYYHYYKLFTDPNQNISGVFEKIFNDDRSQSPGIVNSFQQLTILPEIILGVSYRMMRTLLVDYLKVDFDDWRRCYFVEDENDRMDYDQATDLSRLVSTCEGIGEPFYFYIYAIFVLNSFVPVLVGWISYYLSNGSFCSMLMAIILFAYNQIHCSRVQWAVPLRENFGYPIYLLHNLWLVKKLVRLEKNSTLPKMKSFIFITTLIIFQLLFWQFSSFILFVQSVAIYLSVELFSQFSCGQSNSSTSENFVAKYFIWNIFAVIIQSLIQLNNLFVLRSPYFIFLSSHLSASLIMNNFLSKTGHRHWKKFILLLLFVCWNLVINSKLHSNGNDESNDGHIWSLLASKFNSAFSSFHTQIYTCSKEYDWLGWNHFFTLMTNTFLGPLALAALFFEIWHFSGQQIKTVYNFILTISFFAMAVLIMRLKLLMMPQLCIFSSLILRNHSMRKKTTSNRTIKWLSLSIILGIISIKGLSHIRDNLSHQAQFENRALEQILSVVRQKTSPDSIFGGSMSTMATIMLSTGRRISNNPFYESSSIRRKTYTIYQLYSERDINEVHRQLCELHLDYIIVEPFYCYGHLGRCQMARLWRAEDQRTNYWNGTKSESSKANGQICHQLLQQDNSTNSLFEPIASNHLYHLFRVAHCRSIDTKL